MNRILALLLVSFAGPALLSAQEQPIGGAWTLEAAVAQARAANPDALIAQARVSAARAAQEEAGSAGLPRVDLRATYYQTNNPMQAFGAILSQGTFDNSIDFNSPGQIDSFTAGLYARYALYTGGRITAGKAAAAASAQAASLSRDAVLSDLVVEVARAYFGIRQAADAVAALESALASYDENLRIGVLREQAGQLLRSERLNLEVQRSRTNQQLLAARHQQRLAERQFAFLLGLKPDALVALAASDKTSDRLVAPESLQPTQRPEYAAMQRRVETAERLARAARGARLPSVGAFANVQTDQGWRRNGSGDSWTAGVSAEMPVFDGRETRSRIRSAEAEVAVARESLRKLQLGLALELEQARLKYELVRAQLDVSRQEVAQAEESARLSRERFSAGSLLSAELIGVETRLAEARMRRSANLASERVAVAELRRAAGLPVFP